MVVYIPSLSKDLNFKGSSNILARPFQKKSMIFFNILILKFLN